MIKSITITNHLGESVKLELRFPEKSGFLIRGGVQGLGPTKATINTTEIVTMDGSLFNSAHINQRNIVLSLAFLERPTIEYVRQSSYRYFPTKQLVNIKVETDNRICETYGYVESNEPDIFSESEGTTISIICPNSFFYSIDREITYFSGIESSFEFPFSNESLVERQLEFGSIDITNEKIITYTGDAPIGVIIYIHALGPATNIRINNRRTQEVMVINEARVPGGGIVAGDDIVISTIKGQKAIILQRDGVLYNIRNALGQRPDWFHLEKGENVFAYLCDEGGTNLQFRIENQIAFEGI